MSGVTKSGAWAEKDSVWVLYRLAAAGGKDCPHHTSWQQLPKGICLNAIWQPSAISKPKSGDQFQGLKTLLHFRTRQQTLKCLSGWERRGPWFCRFLHVWGWFWRALFSCITRHHRVDGGERQIFFPCACTELRVYLRTWFTWSWTSIYDLVFLPECAVRTTGEWVQGWGV